MGNNVDEPAELSNKDEEMLAEMVYKKERSDQGHPEFRIAIDQQNFKANLSLLGSRNHSGNIKLNVSTGTKRGSTRTRAL